MPRTFMAGNWFYSAADQTPSFYDSHLRTYVQADDSELLAFLADANATVDFATEGELRDFLNEEGVQYQNEGRPVDARPGPLFVRVVRGLQNVAHNSLVPVQYNRQEADNFLIHDTSIQPDRFVIPAGQTGFYDALCEVQFLESTATAPGTANTGDRLVSVRVNGEFRLRDRRPTSNTGDSIVALAGDLRLQAGDVLQFAVGQDCGGTMDIRSRATLRRSV